MSPVKFGGLRVVVRKVIPDAIKWEVDPDDLIHSLPNDNEATLVRAQAEAGQRLLIAEVEYIKIFRHKIKAPSGVHMDRYFCLDDSVDKMIPHHSSELVETHFRGGQCVTEGQNDPQEASQKSRNRPRRKPRNGRGGGKL